MKMTTLHRLPIAMIAAVVTGSLIAFAAGKEPWEKKARQRKADYIFLEAQSAYSAEEFDKYITLVERAYALNPSDIDIAGEWALLSLLDDNIDSAAFDKSYALLKNRFYARPNNQINGAIFANIALQRGRTTDAVKVWETLDSLYPTKTDPALQLAQAYLRNFIKGDTSSYEKALAIYNRIESGSGKTIDLSNQKIKAYFLKGDTAAIVTELDSLYNRAPNDVQTTLFIGAHYEYLDMPDKAINYYDQACEIDSTNGMAYLSRARFYNEQGDSVAFDREVFHALKSQNLDFYSKMEMLRTYVANLYKDERQEPRIRELFNTLQQQHAGESQVHDLFGAYLYERKDYKGAAEQFSYSVALEPTDESSWMSYVQSAGLADDTIAALNAAQNAIHRFPTNLYFPIIASNMYRMQDRNERAMAVLDSVDISIIENPTAVSNFLTSKGDLYAIIGDTIKSLETYDQAIELDPTNSMALNNAAYFMTLSGGDLDKAESYSARSLKGDELNATYLDTYAWVFYKKKDYKMAKHYIDIALSSYEEEVKTDPDADQSVPPSADTEVYEDELVEEVAEETENAETKQLSADIYDHAGDIYFMNGEHDEAVKFWEKAHELDPTEPIIEKKVKLRTIIVR